MLPSPVLLTKITPPRPPARILHRPRVTADLLRALDYRLTILQAGAGYGKSTALAALHSAGPPFIWYQAADDDSDALVFLLHLCYATRQAFPEVSGLPLLALENWEADRRPLPLRDVIVQYLNAVTACLEGPTLFVLDDAHRVSDNPEIALILDQLIAHAPPEYHLLLSTRVPLQLPNLSHWQARGELLALTQQSLTFSPGEIAELFERHFDYELTPEEAVRIHAATEGWAITLHLVWQSLRSGGMDLLSPDLSPQDEPLENLFELLARDVLDAQPADVQHFLMATAALQVMTAEACDALLDRSDSAAMLAHLRRQELFVVPLDDHTLRYHFIFHRFLRRQSDPQQLAGWHARAGRHYRENGQVEIAIYHFLRAGLPDRAAGLLVSYGDPLLARGRLDTLAAYLDALPPETLSGQPMLLFYHGELARLRNRYEEALGWYGQAETLWRERGQADGIARALRGQARIYIDTVDPARAEDLLQQSLRLADGTSDRESQARLYELLAENKLNGGKPAEAERLRQQADALRQEGPSDSQLPYRILLRTGRLEEARQQLEARLESERSEPVETPRAHRETHFLLSLIYTFEGQAQAAYRTAVAGTERGQRLASPYMTAVGHMRQGLALMLLPGADSYDRARSHFETAIEISRDLAVARLRVEAYWGLCRAYGFKGDLAGALEVAKKGIEIATEAGDEWIASLIRLAMGASLALAGRGEAAEDWLGRARRGFDACADPLGSVSARVMMALNWLRVGAQARLENALPEILAEAQQGGYGFLFSRPTLLGVPDERMLVPLLLLARERGWEPAFAAGLLDQLGLPNLARHPGYQLRFQTFGDFKAWRGKQPIPETGWRRTATRRLCQLLLTHRDAPLEREQIFEHLWPDADPEAAQRNFKVALNTLFKTLEPGRAAGEDSAFIAREASAYRLRPGADVWIDAQAFGLALLAAEEETARAMAHLEDAVRLYQGEFLPDARYEPWAAPEREHLSVQFLQAADRLCALYLKEERYLESIETAQRILAQDRCWERAYRHLMRAYHQLGDHGQVARTYRRCRESLSEELEVSPSGETEALYRQLTQPRP